MSMLQFDDDAARRIQRVYSTPDVVHQRAEVLALLAARPGEREIAAVVRVRVLAVGRDVAAQRRTRVGDV